MGIAPYAAVVTDVCNGVQHQQFAQRLFVQRQVLSESWVGDSQQAVFNDGCIARNDGAVALKVQRNVPRSVAGCVDDPAAAEPAEGVAIIDKYVDGRGLHAFQHINERFTKGFLFIRQSRL